MSPIKKNRFSLNELQVENYQTSTWTFTSPTAAHQKTHDCTSWSATLCWHWM